MHLSRIEIKNFKGLKNVTLSPSIFTCLVGENNAGKSSVLQAVNLALKLQNEISDQLFYDLAEAITFKIQVSNITEQDLSRLTDEQKNKIAQYVIDKEICFLVSYKNGQKIAIHIPTLVPKERRYKKDFIEEIVKGKSSEYSSKIKESFSEWASEITEFKSQAAAKSFIQGKINSLGAEHFEDGVVELPTGIASSIKALLPEPIYIRPDHFH